ncbi:probable palmitoyltransferase ZDHHC24 [Epargyreus clarus]|uniref:probable palmitoyltransferase ZDHHC24 n=1 Tax=Epargyreus clarus TaxID=520877 RepID=UPI003C2C3C28
MVPTFLDYIKKFLKVYEKVICFGLVLFITPGFYIFELTIVRPSVVKIYKLSFYEEVFHIICSTFCFINVVGNMILSIFTDTSLKTWIPEGDTYCELCQIKRPAKAWHCKACNACILRRDHHCFFFSRCIGLYNQRYYVAYLGYIFISMVYSTYYNYLYVAAKFQDHGFALSAFRIINPLLRFMIPEPMGMNDLCVLLIFLNVGLIIWSGSLFWFHMGNVLRGVTAHEYRNSGPIDKSMWKINLSNVFGVKWYWALIWPFAESPLP